MMQKPYIKFNLHEGCFFNDPMGGIEYVFQDLDLREKSLTDVMWVFYTQIRREDVPKDWDGMWTNTTVMLEFEFGSDFGTVVLRDEFTQDPYFKDVRARIKERLYSLVEKREA